LDSRKSDEPVNPASVVKLATSLRALETLGADHRFATTFGIIGAADAAKGIVVDGSADPDFHFENAVLVARALEEEGFSRIRGDLYMGSTFWMGWERGTVGRETNAMVRRQDMARRLLQAWSPASWSADQHRTWSEMAARRGWDAAKTPSVSIDGKVRTDDPPAWQPAVVHRSQPLLVALRRFNVFSNNDIERLDASIGSPSGMTLFLRKRWGDEAAVTSFATSSGLNRNRMTPRLVVRLLRDLRTWLAANGRTPADLMPVLGCGQSTLPELFPRLRASGEANGLAGKTGTLNIQDGGVSALAGYLPAGPGLMFFVAAPGAGNALPKARAAEEDWVRGVLKQVGPVGPLACPEPVPTSDELAEIARPTKVSMR
ncbi:MAG: D-alanyl-D-alanine carboxypeptidase, partial [Candidatus Binatia bacterium]